MVRASAFLVLSLFGSALAVAAPQFDQGAELRKSECDASISHHIYKFPANTCRRMAASMRAFREVHVPMIRPVCAPRRSTVRRISAVWPRNVMQM